MIVIWKLPIVGLARDLRGLAFAFNSRAAYMQLFEWLYPRYLPLFTKAIEVWYNEPFVSTPILKLMAELVQNRSQRLIFEISSPNGILLFREASRLVCTYGNRILTMNSSQFGGGAQPPGAGLLNKFMSTTVDASKDQIYPMKLKGISICFNILKWSLSGGYVNFGVFQLYNDRALNDALEMFIKLLLSFQQNDLTVISSIFNLLYLVRITSVDLNYTFIN